MNGLRPALLVLLATLALALSTGCAGVVQPSELRPASHPLLEGVVARSQLLPSTRSTAQPTADPAVAERARRVVSARLDALDGKRRLHDRPATDLALVRAAFADVPGVRVSASTIAGLRRQTRGVDAPRPGDLLFFRGDGGAPRTAVVRRVRRDGAIEALAVTREAVRSIVVDPAHPHTRRRGGTIVNTFLRARRQGDEAGASYLAGQLLTDVRSALD